ncbi:hypothetical protein LWM68_41295 [Niabella sp. W65]|nr:hypothetical protein [Niabella sp. W65]MCH7368609.1 hypothetical protein [Niabella sp. W65]ULT44198.1 hypothetical protein KRR40_13005 [Niabella sp. I65]
MNWRDTQVSFYSTHQDRTGQILSLGDVLFSRFGDNMADIVALRSLDDSRTDYNAEKRRIKSSLACFSPSATLSNRTEVVSKTGIMQIDLDKSDIEQYDIDELKEAVFSLPFVFYVSLSCTGSGFFALALISEPERQKEYALHVFDVLETYGIKCDRSKGDKYNDLRYVSYDANALYRENVEPLRVKHFKAIPAPKRTRRTNTHAISQNTTHAALIQSQVNNILSAQVGQRWHTVQSAAYTLGGCVWKGLDEYSGLKAITDAIEFNTAFTGETEKYIKCAKDCFAAGKSSPMPEKVRI